MLGFLKQAFREFGKYKAGQMSAAFAYIAVFAIGPLLLVVISLVGFIYGKRAASGELFGSLSSAVGPDTAKTLQNLVAHTSSTGKGVAALVFGVVGLLLAASGLTAQLQNGFDTILSAAPDPKAGLKFTIYTKIKNISIIIMASIVAIASLAVSSVAQAVGSGALLEILNDLVSLLVFIVVLYLIYRVLPDVSLPRGLALKTAIAVSIMFLIGKFVLGIIIGHNGTAGAYGAAAALVVLLLWFYYSGQLLFLGVAGAKVYGERQQLLFPPKKYTVKLKRLEVGQKNDLRGRLLEAFSRGYKTKSQKK